MNKTIKINTGAVRLLVFILLTAALSSAFAQSTAALKHTVLADGHPLALWEKSVASPRGHIVLHHGRTWSSLPDFDLQLPGEDLSLMDGFNALGYSVWALDARGYGETPRDATGWHNPDKAAADLATVLGWLREKTGDKLHVWGWSNGSLIAQLTAQRYPENIQSVTLYGYPVRSNEPFAVDNTSGKPPAAANTAKNAASDFIVEGAISQNAIDEYVRHALQADPVRADWNMLHQWNQLDASKVTVPVLLLQAEFDPLAKTPIHAQVFAELSNANKQWVVLAGGDHAALLETPRMRLISASVNFMEWIKK
jgi:pimeloyl-ACP methyl ester carboxylesterase